ncbi:MAG: hypothetical protein L3J03_05915 [Desulfobacterales bacterium]|nr:hypothetical protein [Desulfobacterales bacterium]
MVKLQKILQAGAILAISLVLLELLLALYDGHTKTRPAPDKQTAFDLRMPAPYIMFHATPDSDVTITTNQQHRTETPATRFITNNEGFRHQGDIPYRKKDNEIRIFVLGGSVVLHGLTNESTIPALLEKKLQARFKDRKIICINTGIQSADSDQELAVLVHQILNYQPDIVIALDGFNDIWTRMYFEPRLGYPFNWSTYENAWQSNQRLKQALADLSTLDMILAMSRIATRINPGLSLENRLATSFFSQSEPPAGQLDTVEIAVRLLDNWRKMSIVTRGANSKFLAILQPVNPGVRDQPVFRSFYGIMNKAIRQLHEKNSLPFYSFDRVLDQQQDLFWDPVHTYDEAHRIYAEKISAILVENGYITD